MYNITGIELLDFYRVMQSDRKSSKTTLQLIYHAHVKTSFFTNATISIHEYKLVGVYRIKMRLLVQKF